MSDASKVFWVTFAGAVVALIARPLVARFGVPV
jgi:uncharacterized membrane protein